MIHDEHTYHFCKKYLSSWPCASCSVSHCRTIILIWMIWDDSIIFMVSIFSCLCFVSLFPLFFINFLFFHLMVALQKLRKIFFISSKKLISFSRYSKFSNFFPSFPHFPDSKGLMEVEWFMMSWIGLRKFADVIFGITHQMWSDNI